MVTFLLMDNTVIFNDLYPQTWPRRAGGMDVRPGVVKNQDFRIYVNQWEWMRKNTSWALYLKINQINCIKLYRRLSVGVWNTFLARNTNLIFSTPAVAERLKNAKTTAPRNCWGKITDWWRDQLFQIKTQHLPVGEALLSEILLQADSEPLSENHPLECSSNLILRMVAG